MAHDGTAWIADGLGMIDLWYQGVPFVNAAYLFDIGDGFALVETGPASAHEHLLKGINTLGRDPSNLRHILLTHIHLDHSGGAGTLLERYPQVDVFVHESGAPHLIDPTNLLRSAGRIYGDRMDALWGTTVPVPEDHVWWVSSGEVLTVGNRVFDVLYTPGHASHHVTYIDRDTKVAVVGDVAGVRIPPAKRVWPPAPPPDFNLEQWHSSVARMRKADPTALFISHFGVVEQQDIAAHLDELEHHLDVWVALVAERQAAGAEREAIVEELARISQAELAEDARADLAEAFALATPYGMSVDGIVRYLRKREEQS
jgi:glyoxylase-like metal-dependent hydrolase (beta-lactamase superfamily II)